ncbi:MAG: hypothetical protein ACYDDF_11695 [Thermoplasmatota archaeon]
MEDLHDMYRGHAHEVDWARTLDHQRARISLADLWWSWVQGRPGLHVLDVGCGPGLFT